jgi:hypothetical protein
MELAKTSPIPTPLLPGMLAGTEAVLSGKTLPSNFTDPWGRRIRKFDFGHFNIQTPWAVEIG